MSDTTQERIAKIVDTFLGVEDHGIFTATLDLNYGDAAQSAGGYALDNPSPTGWGRRRIGTAYGLEFVQRLIAAVGAQSWEKVKGRTIIALIDGGKVVGIKPLPTELGQKFMFDQVREDFDRLTAEEEKES